MTIIELFGAGILILASALVIRAVVVAERAAYHASAEDPATTETPRRAA